MRGTTSSLELLSKIQFLPLDWKENLKNSSTAVHDSTIESGKALELAIKVTNDAFSKALDAMDIANRHSIDFIYDNRVLSSILGSSHNSLISLTEIKMSFRSYGKDISSEEVLSAYKQSGLSKIILFIPGLFTDESLWLDRTLTIDNRNVISSGIADDYKKRGYFPIFLRFNHGKHISDNGKELLLLLSDLLNKDSSLRLNVFCYSIGCLVFRSTLYYARENFSEISIKNIDKVIFISSPDGGSYLEKAGFWATFLMERAPTLAIQLIGIIGNLRSDAIKDLSHGVIREEDWNQFNYLSRYWQNLYFGELDNINCYQLYSSFGEENSILQEWLGDGIVELSSLTLLKENVFLKKDRTQLRSTNITGNNHFTILQSGLLRKRIAEIMEIHNHEKNLH
jgi:pimeloyl-ACP methyl ester carboxylesterase